MTYRLGKVLIPKNDIKKKVDEIAKAIIRDYSGKEVIVIGILRGAVIFMSDLVRAIGNEVDIRMDFMSVSSYGTSTHSSGVVKINKDLDTFIADKHVILVEDIIDSGLTLHYLYNMMINRKPASLKICSLLDKPERRKVKIDLDYVGFSIPDEFVVGFGLDCSGLWRQLSDIHIVHSVE